MRLHYTNKKRVVTECGFTIFLLQPLFKSEKTFRCINNHLIVSLLYFLPIALLLFSPLLTLLSPPNVLSR